MSAATVNRLVCFCDDCRAFAHLLGRGEALLDDNGGTEVLQTTPARLAVTEGDDHLACVKLSPKGILRWYASCCGSPICNTPATPRLPFASLVHGIVDWSAAGMNADDCVGPVRGRVYGRFAIGDTAGLDAHDTAPLGLILRVGWGIIKARLRGEHRRSPFFDAESGKAVRRATVLDAESLRELRAEPALGPEILARVTG